MSLSSNNNFSISTSLNKIVKNIAKIENQDCLIYWDSNSSYRRIYRDENDWSIEGIGGNLQILTGDNVTQFSQIKFFNDKNNFNYKYAVNPNIIDNTTLKIYATNCDGNINDESFTQSYTNTLNSGDNAYRLYAMSKCVSVVRKNNNNNYDIRFYSYKGNNWNNVEVYKSEVLNSDYYTYDNNLINSNSKYLCNNNSLYITGYDESSLQKTIILTPDINGGFLTVSDTIISTSLSCNEILGMKYYNNHGFIAKRIASNIYINQITNLYDNTPIVSDYQLTSVTSSNFNNNEQILFNYKANKYLFNSPKNGLVGELLVGENAGSNFVVNETFNKFTNNSTIIMEIETTDQPDVPVFFGTNNNTGFNAMLYVSDFGSSTDIYVLPTDSSLISTIAFKTDKNSLFSQSSLVDNSVTFTKLRLNSIPPVKASQQTFTSVGETTFTIPEYVYNISAVAVGGGGGGGGGGSSNNGASGYGGAGGGGGELRYISSYNVTPSETITIIVGNGGSAGIAGNVNTNTQGASAGDGGNSTLVYNGSTILRANGGRGGTSGGSTSIQSIGGSGGSGGIGDGGGNGGSSNNGSSNSSGVGGGGAGGYSGNGGSTAANGNGGGGAGGQNINFGGVDANRSGGGVGILGEGSNGISGTSASVGGSGAIAPTSIRAGLYGGGGGAIDDDSSANGIPGGQGAIRIIWGGINRSYPNNNTEDQ